MHVFIDTNVFLSFYHFTNDDLDTLNSIFGSQERDKVVVHITDQVCDEFRRNREAKLKDALKRFTSSNLSANLPNFLKGYPEYSQLGDLSKEFKARQASILEKVSADITSRKLHADTLIEGIFGSSAVLKTTDQIYAEARRRVDTGTPPGKPRSMGDAINWLLLLENVPDNEDLFLITDDSDYYSVLDDSALSPYLADEWHQCKKSKAHSYRSLAPFFKEHYDGVDVSFDKDKKELIDSLGSSGSFAMTHTIIAELADHKDYSLEEARSILDAAVSNNQFGSIVTDEDVAEFLRTSVVPHAHKLITNPERKSLIEEIPEAQAGG